MKRPLDQRLTFVGFFVGEVAYAVPIGSVKEIIHAIAAVELPHLPPGVAGVADHRGDALPVIDLRRRFGLPPLEAGRRPKWIVIELGKRRAALVVDRVTDVFAVPAADVRPAPALGRGDDARGLEGVVSPDGVMTFVLDVDRLASLASGLWDAGLLEGAERHG